MRDILGDKFDVVVVKVLSYETTDSTIDSQILSLQASGADTFISATIPKFAAMTIRKVHDIGWKPLFFMMNVSNGSSWVLFGKVLEGSKS